MNWNNASFVRKVFYLLAIAVLLLPIAALSQPAAIGQRGSADMTAGGKLSQLRERYRLSQAELGEIDPASETMKLATLGLRGVAVDILWYQAMEYQKKQDFNGLEMTVKQIIRLQPNFLKVWDFQAHNLSYNSSVEFDSYRDRYAWVKKGIDFLILGTHYNRDEPGLLYQLGWFTGQKVGRADESKQFRRMFRTDTDLHESFRLHGVDVDQGLGVDGKPDSWLVARQWYDKGERAVDPPRKPIRLKSPLVFYSGGPMSSINGAAAMEKEDGIFGQTARFAWVKAHDSWVNFGNRQIPTSMGFNVRLNAYEELMNRRTELIARLDQLAPGKRAEIRARKIAKLTRQERELLKLPPDGTNLEQMQVDYKVNATNDEIAAEVNRESLSKAREIADDLLRNDREIEMTYKYRGTLNFEYWMTRCEAEQTDDGLAARELVHNADALKTAARNLRGAKEMYEKAWSHWAVLFEKHRPLIDSGEAKDLVESVANYCDVLSQLDEPFPKDFPLMAIMEKTGFEGMELKKRIQLLQDRSSSIPEIELKNRTPKPGTSENEPMVEEKTKDPKEAPPPAKEAAESAAPAKAQD